MTFRTYLRYLMAGIAVLLLVASSALARTFDLPYSGTIGGTHVEAGHYKITWDAQSSDVTVTVASGKDVIATAKGKLESRDIKYRRNSVLYTTKADGSQSVSELRVGGTNTAIVLSE